MSTEPTNSLHRTWEYQKPPPPPPKPTRPKQGMGRNIRVRVENPNKEKRERALTKYTSTTTAMTADELVLLRELRQTDTDNGVAEGTTAKGSVARIQQARTKKKP